VNLVLAAALYLLFSDTAFHLTMDLKVRMISR
jgi:hypothetical protein